MLDATALSLSRRLRRYFDAYAMMPRACRLRHLRYFHAIVGIFMPPADGAALSARYDYVMIRCRC